MPQKQKRESVLARDEVLQKLSTLKHEASLLGFEKLGLFGSVSQNSHSNISDIDVAVVSNRDTTGGGFEYLEKLETLKEMLHKLFRRPVDIYDLTRKKETDISKRVEKEVIYV